MIRSLSTSALGQPSDTSPTRGARRVAGTRNFGLALAFLTGCGMGGLVAPAVLQRKPGTESRFSPCRRHGVVMNQWSCKTSWEPRSRGGGGKDMQRAMIATAGAAIAVLALAAGASAQQRVEVGVLN